ncbi:glycosyltransferase family 2 protein [Luteococcus sp. H101]
MPTYLRQEYLPKAIGSLLQQEFKDFTALICDNANSGTTRKFVESLNDPRLVYVPREHNLGLVRNSLEGFRAAESEFVTKLDDDDEFEPSYLGRCVQALREHPEAAFAFTDMRWIGPDGESLEGVQQQQDESHGYGQLVEGMYRPLNSLLVHGVVALNATVLRTSALDWNAVREDTETAFDLHILLEAARHGAAAYHVAERLVRYRVHPATDSATNYARQLKGRLVALEDALPDAAIFDRPALLSAMEQTSTTLARVALIEGKPADSRAALKPVLRDTVNPAIMRLALLGVLPSRVTQGVMERRNAQWQKRHTMGPVDPPRPKLS